MSTAIDVVMAIAYWGAIATPVIITGGAFLDAARRPEWAWALAGRRRIVWMSALMAGAITVIAGPPIAIFYLMTARKDVANIEKGRFDLLE